MTPVLITSILLTVIGMIAGIILNFYRTDKLMRSNQLIKVINLKNDDLKRAQYRINKLENTLDHHEDVIKNLEMSYLRLKTITVQYPFPFFLKDPNGILIIVNQPWTVLNNIPATEALGKVDYDLFPPEISDYFRKTDDMVAESNKGYILTEDPKNTDNIVLKWKIPSIIKGEYYIAGISLTKDIIH